MIGGASTYEVVTTSRNVQFVLLPKKILVIYNGGEYLVYCTHANYHTRLAYIQHMIRSKELEDIPSLWTEMRINIGEGIKMIPTKKEWCLK